ncbi:MAG: hypothetical protein ACRDK4_03060 [Solirubrobacteraceae bacterium]
MDVLEAVELQGDLVSLAPLEIRHAEGLAVAAEDKRVFEGLGPATRNGQPDRALVAAIFEKHDMSLLGPPLSAN